MYRKNLTKNPSKHTKNHVKKILKTYAAETLKNHTKRNHAAETFEILTNKTLKSYTTRTFKTAAAETLRTHAAEPLKTHTTGNHAAETPGTNNTKNNPLDNGKMIENAAYFYAKNNTGNNTKKYVFNHTLETVRSAYKTTHITNATVLPQKRKNGLNRANNASQDHFNYLLIQSQKHFQRRTLPPKKRMLQMYPVKFQHIKKEEIIPEENEIKARAKTIPSKKKKQTLLIRKICFVLLT